MDILLLKTLITKVEPDAEVKQSMNEINAAQRKRVAAQELAVADKIKIVTAAEAEAEKDRLHGVGIAEQRKAIVDGLADSIKELKGANVDLTEEQIMSILLTNQYLDTLNTFADKEGIIRFSYQQTQMASKTFVQNIISPESKVNYFSFFKKVRIFSDFS